MTFRLILKIHLSFRNFRSSNVRFIKIHVLFLFKNWISFSTTFIQFDEFELFMIYAHVLSSSSFILLKTTKSSKLMTFWVSIKSINNEIELTTHESLYHSKKRSTKIKFSSIQFKKTTRSSKKCFQFVNNFVIAMLNTSVVLFDINE